MSFVHLHVHSHYSILDGMSKVPDLVDKCVRLGMPAMALTDHGNMFGIKEFTDYANKCNKKTKGKIADQEAIIADETSTDEQKESAKIEIEKLKKKFFKPIIGCEAYCARRKYTDHDNTVRITEGGKSIIADHSGWHLILLAKNKKGYQSLCKLISAAWIDGFYSRPRIDKELLEKYSEGLIVCSACLGGELPKKILSGNIEEAERTAAWFKSIFGDDYYIELQRHKTDKPGGCTSTYEIQEKVNPKLVEIARKLDIKIICTNDVHFVDEEHSEAHERLVCMSTGSRLNDEGRKMSYSKQEWLKSPDEMSSIFSDYPEALSNTLEIADKVETYSIESDPIMPKFEIPTDFGTEETYRHKFSEQQLFDEFTRDEKGNVVLEQKDAEKKIAKLGGYDKLYRIKLEADYLAKLAWEGAHKRYGENLTEEQIERITFELHIMKTMGFPGYFLIVMDYIRAAREELNVSVGPGRGSAAGSVVAYCLKITDVDPLKYDLLFERFLNPDRISLPDIDVDFDDDGRGRVLDWVTEKYGKEKVAHIITYGTMATKSSIADVGRVQDVPLSDVNSLKSLVPDKFDDSVIDPDTKKTAKVNMKNCLRFVDKLKEIMQGENEMLKSTLTYATQLENTIRQTGIHACGVIIGADDLTKFAPISTVDEKGKDENGKATNKKVMVTQYDGHVIESVGLIKMDFLGLKTLNVIKEALKNIKKSHGIDIDIDNIPIDDKLTYELYSRGETIGTFQFESLGMQRYLRQLHPTVFEDLIAMNALYRPGPLQYIPTFIRRKLGQEEINYDLPCMKRYLKDTYGVTVYQEQVMLLSRLLANFTRGESDTLRKAMGKKMIDKMNELKAKFIKQGLENPNICDGLEKRLSDDELKKTLEKIWSDWEEFAKYAFNKSHATCYSWVAYQTAYLKAHYPSDYMAANLTRSMDNIEDLRKFMKESKRMGIQVLSPDINESDCFFMTNKDGDIRFGLQGIKGMSKICAEATVAERTANGPFKDIFDYVKRVPCAGKDLECLAQAGAFDSFPGIHREQMSVKDIQNISFSTKLSDYGKHYRKEQDDIQSSLFAGESNVSGVKIPDLPKFEAWGELEKLQKEKELVGVYLSAHPLDDYYLLLKYTCNTKMNAFEEKDSLPSVIIAGGLVTSKVDGLNKRGNPNTKITIEDFDGSYELMLWGQDVGKASFIMPNMYVIFRATNAPSSYDPSKKFLSFQEFKILNEVKDNTPLSATITMNEKDVSETFVEEISKITSKPGRDSVSIEIVSDEENSVPLLLQKQGITITRELTDYLDNLAGNTEEVEEEETTDEVMESVAETDISDENENTEVTDNTVEETSSSVSFTIVGDPFPRQRTA